MINIKNKKRRLNVAKVIAIILVISSLILVALSAMPQLTATVSDVESESVIAEIAEKQPAEETEEKDARITNSTGVNKDTIGWIKIPGTKIDYPVVQTTDDSHYLNYNFNGQKSIYGAIFAGSKFNTEHLGRTTVIYGHSVTGDKNQIMFSDLKKFENIDFVKDNSTFTFNTNNENGKWAVIGCFWTSAKAEEDNGYILNYIYPDMSANDMEGFLAEMNKRSFYTSDIQTDAENDNFLILSTCTRGLDTKQGAKTTYKAEGRLVVVAVKVAADVTVNYTVNSNPKMPQIYYDNHGIENPYANDAQWFPTRAAV